MSLVDIIVALLIAAFNALVVMSLHAYLPELHGFAAIVMPIGIFLGLLLGYGLIILFVSWVAERPVDRQAARQGE